MIFTSSIFTSSKNTFEGQLPEEETILVTRKHWFVIFAPLLLTTLSFLLPLLVYFLIGSFGWYSNISALFWFLTALYFLILWHLIFQHILIYTLNTVTLTNKRIIDNEQKGLFNHAVNTLALDKIQDISINVQGLLAEFLNFGDIEIQTAGSLNKFHFAKLPNPHEVKQIIITIKSKNNSKTHP